MAQEHAKHEISKNFIKRYWRGDYSLPVSYWGVSFITNIIIVGIVNILQASAGNSGSYNPISIFISILSVYGIVGIISVWQLVGIWRSSGNYIRDPQKGRFWGFVARFMVVLSAIQISSQYIINARPQLAELFEMAMRGDPEIPPFKLTVTGSGTEIRISGGIKYGLVSEFNKLLDQTPRVTTVELDSVGGRIGEATDLEKAIRIRRLNTVVNKECLSACTVVFAGGINRWLGVHGTLGFHSTTFAGMDRSDLSHAESRVIDEISSANNVPKQFLSKAYATPNKDMWYPDRNVLFENNYITSRVSNATSSKDLIEKMHLSVIKDLNKDLPKKVDQDTTLTKISASSNSLIYSYEIPDNLLDRLNEKDQTYAEFKLKLQTRVCSSDVMRENIQKGIVYIYNYVSFSNKDDAVRVYINRCSTKD